MSATNDILQRCPLAIATHLRTLADASSLGDLVSTSIFAQGERGPAGTSATAEESSTPLPKVVVVARTAKPHFASGNWLVDVDVEVHSDGDSATAAADHAARVGVVTDVFLTNPPGEIHTTLSAALADFTVLGLMLRSATHGVAGRRQVYGLGLEILCCCSDIS